MKKRKPENKKSKVPIMIVGVVIAVSVIATMSLSFKVFLA